MDRKRVLVTGVGGNVAQGILRNIRRTGFDIFTVGTNTSPFSAGNHLCDEFHLVPYALDREYISSITRIVQEEKIDLVIPSTDFEVCVLAEHRDKLSASLAASDAATTKLYLDKWLTFLAHQSHNIPFADCWLPEDYRGQFQKCVLKPRQGRGSRGLSINPSDIGSFVGKDYLVQRFLEGVEFSTAFYVARDNRLHGLITFERILERGTTTQCRVVQTYDEKLSVIIKQMMGAFDIRGSANVQWILTDSMEISPFEVNCRISGTNSIRSHFGFDDVRYTLQEYLYGLEPDVPDIRPGVAVRMLTDIIYPDALDYAGLSTIKSPHFLF